MSDIAISPQIEPGDERIDWRGEAVDCHGCVHAAMAKKSGTSGKSAMAGKDAITGNGHCQPGHACVEDRYARRIDRFFDWNPALADGHIRHPHFEVRAIAAKHADVFLLPGLLNDDEEAVRWNAVRRLPARYKLKLRNDPHREVRIRIAAELDDDELIPMLDDSDYYVRLVVARRIAPRLLRPLMSDSEPEVRRVVACRLPLAMLAPMAYDTNPTVRLNVAERMSVHAIAIMRNDVDWRIRHCVASRVCDREVLRQLVDDPDPVVRETAAGRLNAEIPVLAETAS